MPPEATPIPSPEAIADRLTHAALEKKAYDLAILDMAGKVDYADVLVLCTASNRRQVQAVADEVRRAAKEEFDLNPRGIEGYDGGRWVLVDFGDVLVHIFDGPMRGFYALDELWEDAPRLPVPEPVEPRPPQPFHLP